MEACGLQGSSNAPITATKKLGLGATILFALFVLALAFWANTLFYGHNLHLVQSDSVHYMAKLGEVVRNSKLHGPLATMGEVLDYGTTSLSFLLVALFGPLLPVSMSNAVVLNGIWLLCLGVSSYLLFWQTSRSALLSFTFTVPLLSAPQVVGGVVNGLTDIDPNLLGYTIGGSALCWMLLSERFRRPGAAALAGLFLGFLVLGRVFMVGLLAPAVFPLAVLGLFTGTKEERRRTLVGLTITTSVAVLVSIFWLVPKISLILNYPGRFWGTGLIGQASMLSSAAVWGKFTLEVLIFNPLMPVVFIWSCLAAVRAKGWVLALKQSNWMYLWLAAIPLGILVALRIHYLAYGVFALCGLHLLMMFPLRRESEGSSVTRTPRFRWAALGVACLGAAGSLSWMLLQHGTAHTSKENALAAVHAIMADAAARNLDGVRIKMANNDCTGVLKPVNLDNLFLFETPFPISSYRRGGGDILAGGARHAQRPEVSIVCSLPNPLYHEVSVRLCSATDQERDALVETTYPEFIRDADYFVIRGPQSQATFPDPIFSLLSRRLLADRGFRQLTSVLQIAPEEDVIVLARVGAGSELANAGKESR